MSDLNLTESEEIGQEDLEAAGEALGEEEAARQARLRANAPEALRTIAGVKAYAEAVAAEINRMNPEGLGEWQAGPWHGDDGWGLDGFRLKAGKITVAFSGFRYGDKVAASRWLPNDLCRRVRNFGKTIRFAATKSPEQAAKEVYRRLLPGAAERLGVAEASAAGAQRGHAEVERVGRVVVAEAGKAGFSSHGARFGGATSEQDTSQEATLYLYGTEPNTGRHGEARVTCYAESPRVDLRLNGLTEAEALRVLATLAV